MVVLVAMATVAASVGNLVKVQGQLLRKRRFSKALIFGDIKLPDGSLLELMIRAADAWLTKDDIVQLNWALHLGDTVTLDGRVETTAKGHLLLVVRSAVVNVRWEEQHPGVPFGHGATDLIAPSESFGQRKEYTNIVQIQGHNACKYYFNNASCVRGADCHFWHGPPEDYKALRAEWFARRGTQKREQAALDGDVHDPHEKGMKAQRARIFCDWLVATFGVDVLSAGAGVVDVAGGKGDIPFELFNKRAIPATLIEPRPRQPRKVHHKHFAKTQTTPSRHIQACLDPSLLAAEAAFFAETSVFVGMHPDEATEPIVDCALAANKPFAVVPCCVMSRKFPDRRHDGEVVGTYDAYIAYLRAKDSRIQSAFLPFAGKNQVLFVLP
ncbi:hypothetical protein SDRG_05411 [Saprolegnia diclina VS20]|uniref:C3H1-type domain-containing protein n=1 Tax=Saprolegnia diclina (strain VS20) TaxID=1156394 RepID=T0QT50_SAPDV|nr:hypothetical protein SDRG_05411 [Saprolegnia diclina VS20]EQC37185.1 hypothetical protein SDRG_05411 [Saprolegnia diclina VS20]|eukprot:XP_008609347.1 hypothetical protein SDRG_05411 [Saprolegnia diclina VS20]